MFNLFIIAVLDFIGGDEPIFAQGEEGQTLTAALGVLLIGLAVYGELQRELCRLIHGEPWQARTIPKALAMEITATQDLE